MDPSMGKGSAPTRNSFQQISQSPLCSTGHEIEDVCPLSDTHLDQSTTLPFETVSGRPVNNCAKLYASWPAQVTITPVPFSSVYPQSPSYSSNPPPPAQIGPQISLPSPPGGLNINPNLSFGNQQGNPQPQKCPVVTTNCTPTADGASNPPFSVIQPLCYGPVSEGHYVVLQPLCCTYRSGYCLFRFNISLGLFSDDVFVFTEDFEVFSILIICSIPSGSVLLVAVCCMINPTVNYRVGLHVCSLPMLFSLELSLMLILFNFRLFHKGTKRGKLNETGWKCFKCNAYVWI